MRSKEASLILFVSICAPTPCPYSRRSVGGRGRGSPKLDRILPPLSTCPILTPRLMQGEVAGPGLGPLGRGRLTTTAGGAARGRGWRGGERGLALAGELISFGCCSPKNQGCMLSGRRQQYDSGQTQEGGLDLCAARRTQRLALPGVRSYTGRWQGAMRGTVRSGGYPVGDGDVGVTQLLRQFSALLLWDPRECLPLGRGHQLSWPPSRELWLQGGTCSEGGEELMGEAQGRCWKRGGGKGGLGRS